MLTTAHGRPVVIDGGKAGILIELDAQDRQAAVEAPGRRARRARERRAAHRERHARARSCRLPAKFCLEPSIFGGIETQLASNGSTTFAAVNDLALPAIRTGYTAGAGRRPRAAVEKAAGEMVAVNQDTGTVEWDTPLPSSPYGAATVTNNVVFTTTFQR